MLIQIKSQSLTPTDSHQCKCCSDNYKTATRQEIISTTTYTTEQLLLLMQSLWFEHNTYDNNCDDNQIKTASIMTTLWIAQRFILSKSLQKHHKNLPSLFPLEGNSGIRATYDVTNSLRQMTTKVRRNKICLNDPKEENYEQTQ